MSHANMNPFSTAGSLFEIPQQPSTGTSEPANPKAMHLFSPNMAHDIHTLPDMSWIFGHDEGDSGIASRDAANDYSTGSFAPLDFGSGTVTPDSSFDLDTSKDQSTLAIAQQNPHPTDKDSSSYLLQKQRLDEPDGLLPFFPVMEQRHQVRPGQAEFSSYDLSHTLMSVCSSGISSTMHRTRCSWPQSRRRPTLFYATSLTSLLALMQISASPRTHSDTLYSLWHPLTWGSRWIWVLVQYRTMPCTISVMNSEANRILF